MVCSQLGKQHSVSTHIENQILIPDWAYFHCPGATLVIRLSLACYSAKVWVIEFEIITLIPN